MVNKTMKTIYRKVEIKSEHDLPKEDGIYYTHRIRENNGMLFMQEYRKREFDNLISNDEYWLSNIDWYLQPIEPQEPLKNHPVYTLNCDKCKRAYSSADAFPEDQLCDKCFAEKYLRHHKKEHPKTAELGRLKFSDVENIIKMVDENDVIGNHGVVYEVVCIALEEYAHQERVIEVTDEESHYSKEDLEDAFNAGMEYDRMIHGNCIDGESFNKFLEGKIKNNGQSK